MALNTFCQRCTSLLKAKWKHVSDDDYCWSSEDLYQAPGVLSSSDTGDEDAAFQDSPFQPGADQVLEEHDPRLLAHRPQFHLNLAELQARSGVCHLCSYLYNSFKDWFASIIGTSLKDVSNQELASVSLLPKLTWPDDADLELSFDFYRGMRLDKRLRGRIILACHSDPSPRFLRPSKSFREETASRISEWIQTCKTSHEGCRTLANTLQSSSSAGFLPSRLLKILHGPVIRIQLQETKDFLNTVAYAALSHTWGDARTTVLDAASLLDLRRGVDIKDLPRTFRESISAAVSLKIDYVWIDSLCIMQDSKQDWQRESTTMASLYSHATVTFAASYSKDCHGGLFGQSQDELCLNPPVADVDWREVTPPLGTIPNKDRVVRQQFMLLDVYGGIYNVGNSTLSHRSWTYQESMLSVRIIHFAGDQLRWSCKTRRRCESTDLKLYSEWVVAMHQSIEPDDIGWDYIVSGYSERKLTRQTDVFAAMGGIAEVYAHMHGFMEQDYLAGLWIPQMPLQLLWKRSQSLASCNTLVPSWSWAKMHGFGYRVHFLDDRGHWRHQGVANPHVRILNGSANYPTEASFTHPTVGRLHIECLLHMITLKLQTSGKDETLPSGRIRYSEAFLGARRLESCSAGRKYGCSYEQPLESQCTWEHFHVRLDDPSLLGAVEAFFLPLMCLTEFALPKPWGPRKYVAGLVLERLDHTIGTYRRIGFMEVVPGHKDDPDLETFPEWHQGAALSPDEYIADLGNGRYEIEII